MVEGLVDRRQRAVVVQAVAVEAVAVEQAVAAAVVLVC